jgi:hypothetical protein
MGLTMPSVFIEEAAASRFALLLLTLLEGRLSAVALRGYRHTLCSYKGGWRKGAPNNTPMEANVSIAIRLEKAIDLLSVQEENR